MCTHAFKKQTNQSDVSKVILDSVAKRVYTGGVSQNFAPSVGAKMNQGPQDLSQVFHLDVSAGNENPSVNSGGQSEIAELLRQLVVGQDRQNELLEDVVDQMNAGQRQRAAELGQWKEANPILARRCRAAAEALGQVQTEFIENMTYEINENHEGMLEGEFILNEFVDRFGPRLAHLNGVLQLLSQLSSMPGHNNQNH